MSDGNVRTLHAGKGNYKGLAFDEAGKQLAFVSDQAEYDKDVSPYRLYHWKAGEAAATELVSADHTWRAAGAGRQRSVLTALLRRRPAALSRHRAAAAPLPRRRARRRPPAWTSGTGAIRCCSRCSACAPRRSATATTARSCISPDKRFVQLATADMPNVNPGDDATRAPGDVRPAVPAAGVVGHQLQRRRAGRSQDRAAPADHGARALDADDVVDRQVPAVLRRGQGQLVHLPARPTARRSNLTEKLGRQLLA